MTTQGAGKNDQMGELQRIARGDPVPGQPIPIDAERAMRQELTAERRFVIERSFQFLNFGIVTLGLGLGACFSEQAREYRTTLATLLAVLFLGATWVGVFS